MEQKKSKRIWGWLAIILTGVCVGVAAVVLSANGNPANMGFCIACFLRDIAGALKLQTAANGDGATILSYLRPEIMGLVLGATILSLIRKEFRPQGGSSPFTRFLVAIFVMIGALVFLGCPLRMVIRIGSGDLNALFGLLGFVIGIAIGILFLKLGFSFGRAHKQSMAEGLLFPILMVALLFFAFGISQNWFGMASLFGVSTAGPGSKFAPILLSLAIALVIGALCQNSRLCMVGGIRDAFLFRDFHLLSGFAAILVTVFLGNVILKGTANFFSFPAAGNTVISNPENLYNVLGMILVGWGSVMLGGCPLRQLILAGEGNTDSAITVVGMIVGAGLAHNFKLASGADGIGKGPVLTVIIVGFVAFALISILNLQRKKA